MNYWRGVYIIILNIVLYTYILTRLVFTYIIKAESMKEVIPMQNEETWLEVKRRNIMLINNGGLQNEKDKKNCKFAFMLHNGHLYGNC